MILYGCQFTKTTEKNLPSHTAPFKVPHAAESRCTTHLFSLELQNPVLAHAGKYPPRPQYKHRYYLAVQCPLIKILFDSTR